ncbi:MAG: hypothetical protein EZS28_024919 [Streblomastix strix]|uniref:Uncharacterized protein n=1 Tax=Streblomastix strix TaxID=222440 RepID=A0A5J4VAM6_9EUKA|nr:MAG: hypothetical protein EZS28_024919 [Streblomastix strix]
MTAVPAQNIASGQNVTDPSKKLLIHIGGTIALWVAFIISCVIFLIVGIVLLVVLSGGDKFVSIIFFLSAAIFILVLFLAGRKDLLNNDLLLDANEEFGSFTTTPHPWAKCCCLSTEHRQFYLREVTSIQQLMFRYGKNGRYTGFRVIFVLPDNEQYQPPMILGQYNIEQIVQFFRTYNEMRQNYAPVYLPPGLPSTGQYDIAEVVYLLNQPMENTAYPPSNPNQQQLEQQQTSYAPPYQQQSQYSSPDQQQKQQTSPIQLQQGQEVPSGYQ